MFGIPDPVVSQPFQFPREGTGTTFNHNLRTVVVDAHGRVQKVFIGNEWKVEDFVEEMVKAAGVKDR